MTGLLIAGRVKNKFRGDRSILDPGLDDLSRRTGPRNFGAPPYLREMWIDGEDALEVARWHRDGPRREGRWRGEAVSGYEIHHGRAACGPGDEEFLDGVRVGSVWATMWHGSRSSPTGPARLAPRSGEAGRPRLVAVGRRGRVRRGA